MKMRPPVPNMEEILNPITTETPRAQTKPLWILKIDIEYAYGQLNLSKERSRRCNFTKTDGNLNGC